MVGASILGFWNSHWFNGIFMGIVDRWFHGIEILDF